MYTINLKREADICCSVGTSAVSKTLEAVADYGALGSSSCQWLALVHLMVGPVLVSVVLSLLLPPIIIRR